MYHVPNSAFIRTFCGHIQLSVGRNKGTDADAKETGRETDFDVERKDFVVELDGT